MLLRYVNLLVILLAVQGWCKPSKDINGDYNDDTPSEDYTDEYSSTGDDNGDSAQDPPQIISKSMTIHVPAGSTVTLNCLVKNAEDNAVVWKKDNEFLYSDANPMTEDSKRIVRTQNNSLVIHDVTSKDSSDHYECSVLSSSHPVSITHKLLVGPPLTLPNSQNHPSNVVRVTPGETVKVKQGESVTLGCHTNLEPPFEIKWFRKSKRLPSGEETVNGSYITIHATDRHHGGIYQCLADNGMQTPPHAAINVIVEHPPEVEADHEIIYTGVGAETEISCVVHAHPHAKITWYKDQKEVIPKKGRIILKDYKTKHGLRIVHVTEHDLGRYMCLATNELGQSGKTTTLTGVPSQPRLYSGEVTKDDKGLILKWHLQSYAPITEYKLQYRRKGESEWTIRQPPVISGDESRYSVEYPIRDLEPGSYEAIIQAKNAYGWSPASVPHDFDGEYAAEQPESVSTSGAVARSLETAMTVLLVLSPYIFASL